MTRARSVLAGMAFVTVLATRAVAGDTETTQTPPAGAGPQTPQPAADAGGPTTTLSLDRVRSGLRQDLYIDTKVQEPTFRTEVTGHVITLRDYWTDDSTAVAGYVRPRIPQGHLDYLNMARSPVGSTGRPPFQRINDPYQVVKVPIFMVDVTPLMTLSQSAARQIRGAVRERQRRGLRAQIRRELKDVDAANAQPPAAAPVPRGVGVGTRQP